MKTLVKVEKGDQTSTKFLEKNSRWSPLWHFYRATHRSTRAHPHGIRAERFWRYLNLNQLMNVQVQTTNFDSNGIWGCALENRYVSHYSIIVLRFALKTKIFSGGTSRGNKNANVELKRSNVSIFFFIHLLWLTKVAIFDYLTTQRKWQGDKKFQYVCIWA